MPRKNEPASATRRYIADRLKALRLFRGMSQDALADKLGLTFQQIQKYEKALNRISSDTLVTIAAALGVNPCYFFEGIEGASTSDLPPPISASEFELLAAYRGLPTTGKTSALTTMRNLATMFSTPANEAAPQKETA